MVRCRGTWFEASAAMEVDNRVRFARQPLFKLACSSSDLQIRMRRGNDDPGPFLGSKMKTNLSPLLLMELAGLPRIIYIYILRIYIRPFPPRPPPTVLMHLPSQERCRGIAGAGSSV